MWDAHLHTGYERELVPLFFKVRGIYALRSELENDTADCSQVITGKLCAQPSEQRNLLGIEGFTVGKIIIPNPDTSTIAAADSFNGVCAHECRNEIGRASWRERVCQYV